MNLQDLIKEYETDKTTETDGLVYDKYKATLDDGRDIPLIEMLEIFCTLHRNNRKGNFDGQRNLIHKI